MAPRHPCRCCFSQSPLIFPGRVLRFWSVYETHTAPFRRRVLVFVSLGFAFFLYQYVVGGAGLQAYPLFSSGSVLVGLVHVIGLGAATLICFAIGSGLCAHGLVPKARAEEPTSPGTTHSL
jgi:hypothetical protein